MKEWALGGLGFIFGMSFQVSYRTGQEAPGHGRSGLQRRQPVPSLVLCDVCVYRYGVQGGRFEYPAKSL